MQLLNFHGSVTFPRYLGNVARKLQRHAFITNGGFNRKTLVMELLRRIRGKSDGWKMQDISAIGKRWTYYTHIYAHNQTLKLSIVALAETPLINKCTLIRIQTSRYISTFRFYLWRSSTTLRCPIERRKRSLLVCSLTRIIVRYLNRVIRYTQYN